MACCLLLVLLVLLYSCFGASAYNLVTEYSGTTFFQGWNFYGFRDNLSWGNVTWVDETTATNNMLAYVNSAGNAILRVDNTTDVLPGDLRNSVRITTQEAYDTGSLWILDALHIPYGCSVWPAFWSFGPVWPDDGEIDIIEGVNMMTSNQMVLHTLPGCTHESSLNETGTLKLTDCGTHSGCVVSESQPNSFAAGFATAGGGVWATLFDTTGIFMWFWSRPDVPASITQAGSSIDISAWGEPSANYGAATCDISQFFTPQNIVLDITLCGSWAGEPSNFKACAGATGVCYNDTVVGPGSPTYDEAWFEVSYLKIFTNVPVAPTSTVVIIETQTSTAGRAGATQGSQTTSKNGSSDGKLPCGTWRFVPFFVCVMTFVMIIW